MFKAQLEAVHLGHASCSTSQATAFAQQLPAVVVPDLQETRCFGAQARTASPLPDLLRLQPGNLDLQCGRGEGRAEPLWDPPFLQDPCPQAADGTRWSSRARAATGYMNIATNPKIFHFWER